MPQHHYKGRHAVYIGMVTPFTSEQPRRLCRNIHSVHFGMATPFGRNLQFIFRHIRHLYKYRFIEFIISCYELIRNRHGWQNQQRRKLAALRAKETKMISKTSKKAAPGGEILPGAALFYGVLSPYWSVYWSVQKSNFEANSLQINIKKNS